MRTWLSRNLLVLSLVSLTQDAASDFLYPLLPLVLTGLLAAPPVVVGLVEGIADATAGITRYFAGRWSDTRGRKVFIGFGYTLAAIGKVFVAAAISWPLVLVGRVIDRFGKGVRSAPRDALIAASVPKYALGRAFGFHRAADSFGAVIGPMLGLLALTLADGDVRKVLWFAVIPAALSAVLVILVRTPEEELAQRQARMEQRLERKRIKPTMPSKFWWVVSALVAVSVINFSDALVLLRLMDLGFSTTHVVLGYVVYNSVYTIASYPAGVLTDKWPPLYAYAIGLIAFGVSYLGLGLIDGGPVAFLLMGVGGLFPAFTDGVGKAWIAAIVPADHRGRGQGLFQAWNAGAVLLAGTWAGLFWTAGGGKGTIPLMLSGTLAFVAVAVLLALRNRLNGD